jgi:hypothetical protein
MLPCATCLVTQSFGSAPVCNVPTQAVVYACMLPFRPARGDLVGVLGETFGNAAVRNMLGYTVILAVLLCATFLLKQSSMPVCCSSGLLGATWLE